ncbi:MAG TPA: septum site-determining protein MinC [Chiayiivirga sp.]|jgi:septum site-determining protein MinC|uniref:Probable septum site-determining protein MinC n=1 Tax=Denitratimonas tolerans TaxID=1338420 RepID=A0AAW9QZW8_9GAMM|nr:septum site-determining protein MinC [Chiayiivirga sp.]HMN35390.1 septum site-determining protein MinC [Chiayiivirga sp.]HRN58948.1 septum site-determining protein MinC [Chiayiivirga sp.]HRO86758.1 septum site-determining protein MinC [Chiayiivirga sp.]HRQ34314.1 septum site-determining protein MinC [Chiayiivirga sp.]
MAARPDYEQAGELKMGQVGIANLRVRTLDVARLGEEMRERVERAPNLFARAAVVVDFGGLSQLPDAAAARALLDALRGAGVLPVALAYGTREIEALAAALGLPLLAKFRAQYESAGRDSAPPAPAVAAVDAPVAPAAPAVPAASASAVSRMHATPVRSGQQVYAQGRDLVVAASVGAGAEVIADGSVHVYGPLRGRALAGAQGDEKARIFCREFHAELVAIAGRYKVIEEVPRELRGKAVQVWLEDDSLRMAELT